MIDIFKKAQPPSAAGMSEDEHLIQLEKIDLLKYQNFLLEFLAHKLTPGNMEFRDFQQHLRNAYAARLQKEQGSV